MQSIANFLLIQFPKYITETRNKLSVVALLFVRVVGVEEVLI